jgi:hypothetical protein
MDNDQCLTKLRSNLMKFLISRDVSLPVYITEVDNTFLGIYVRTKVIPNLDIIKRDMPNNAKELINCKTLRDIVGELPSNITQDDYTKVYRFIEAICTICSNNN